MTTARERSAWPAAALAGALLALALAAVTARAEEAFDTAAAACAEAEENSDAPDGTESQHLLAAAIWSKCLKDQVVLAETQVGDQLTVTLDPAERRVLKRRRKAFTPLFVASTFVGAFAATDGLTPYEPGAGVDRELSLRRYLGLTTDLRYLGLVSFRTTWQHVLAAAERHRVRLLDEIVEDLEAFDRMAGVADTPSGRKVVKLGELAVVLSNEMQERRAAMGVPADALPEFGAQEDRAARRDRLRFKGLGAEYGDLLVTFSRVVRRIKERIASAAEEAEETKCTLTHPEVGEIGGGWVRYTVDGGPEVVQPGESNIRKEPGIEDYVIGSDSRFAPSSSYVQLWMEGDAFTRPGTHTVTGFPSRDPDGELRNFLAGEYLVYRPASGGNFDARYVIGSGTVTLDLVRIDAKRGKRLIAGSFDVIATSPGGNISVHLVGTFHLCRFRIEGPDGLY